MFTNAITRLTQEINKFVRYLEPTEYEIDCRDHVVRKIQQHTHNQIPNAQVYAFGSLETKLLLPSRLITRHTYSPILTQLFFCSDVDIAVMYPSIGRTQKSILKKLRNGLGRYGIRIEYVAHNAKVIVKTYLSAHQNTLTCETLSRFLLLNVSTSKHSWALTLRSKTVRSAQQEQCSG